MAALVLTATLLGCGKQKIDDGGVAVEEAAPPPSPISLVDPFSSLLPWPEGDSRIVRTDSGLEYIVLRSGAEDGIPPKPENLVVVHYDGRLVDGKKFDSSRDRGQASIFPAGRLIPGWVEALQLMRPGDRIMLYIPYALAYGEAGRPPIIPPSSDLIFDVELLEVRESQDGLGKRNP